MNNIKRKKQSWQRLRRRCWVVPPDEVALYRKLTNSLLTARILGIGGRFRGLDMVKALVENGASFCKEGNFHFQTID